MEIRRRPRRGDRSAPTVDPARSERGAALIAVLAMMTSVLLVGMAIFSLGISETELVEAGVDGAQAFYLAEAGIDRAVAWLNEHAAESSYPSDAVIEDEPLGEGTYSVTLTNTGTSDPWFTRYDVVSTGTVGGVSRRVRAEIRIQAFSRYLYFTHNMPANVEFTTNERFDGPVHSNGWIRIDGDPWFTEPVSTTKQSLKMSQWSEPTFEKGYVLSADKIGYPSGGSVSSSYSVMAQEEGVYGGKLNGSNALYELEFGRNGMTGYVSYRAYRRVGGSYQWSSWIDLAIEDTGGLIWAEEPLWMSGILDGQVTVGGRQNIYVSDDLLYADSDEEGPADGCDDMLGIISKKNVIIADTSANRDNCVIHASIMALGKSLLCENVWAGPPRGDLTIHGSVVQKKCGRVGIVGAPGSIIRGYRRDYHHDPRLIGGAAPWFPQTGSYFISSWKEDKDVS